MPKDLSVSLLLDYYGEVLTDRQREAIDLYYNEDLSLAEISENLKVTRQITRQGVRDLIKRGENVMRDLDSKLALIHRYGDINSKLADIKKHIEIIYKINERFDFMKEISIHAEHIMKTLEATEV